MLVASEGRWSEQNVFNFFPNLPYAAREKSIT
jgi:hypothetical protein